MATETVHLDGIRLQAERVVRAYKELRADTKSADFKSDDWPVGLFAELMQQIKLLDGWLEPVAEDVAALRARCEALGYRLYVTPEGAQLVVDHFPDSDRTPEVVFIHTDAADDDLEDWLADREQVSARVRQAGQVKRATADLHRAAEKVIKLYRADGWDALAGETDGGYKPLPELEEALGKLETALDVETDTAEVLASQGLKRIGPNEAFAASVSDRIDALDAARDDAQRVAYDVRFLVEAALKLNTNGADDGPLEQVLKAAKDKLVAHANALDSVKFGVVQS